MFWQLSTLQVRFITNLFFLKTISYIYIENSQVTDDFGHQNFTKPSMLIDIYFSIERRKSSNLMEIFR